MPQYRGEGRFVRQAGCPAHYGHVQLIAEGAPSDATFALRWHVNEGTIPIEFADAVRAGVLQALAEARWASPLTVAIVGGSYHFVDSQSGDYREAARRAMHQALERMTQGSPE